MSEQDTQSTVRSMSFRAFNKKYLEPIMMGVMIFGIAALCQPWSDFFHRYGLTIMIFGLAGFITSQHIAPEPEED